jgi:hypothetical protein
MVPNASSPIDLERDVLRYGLDPLIGARDLAIFEKIGVVSPS